LLSYFVSCLEEQRSRYFLWVPVFLGAGAGSYFALKFEPAFHIGICFIGIVLLLSIAFKSSQIAIKLTVLATMFFLLGLLLASFRAHSVAAPVLTEPYFGTIEGRVMKLDRSQSNRLRITLDRVILYGLEAAQTPERVRITLRWICAWPFVALGRTCSIIDHDPADKYAPLAG